MISNIIEGWKNNLTPEQFLDKQVKEVSINRMIICTSCPEHSKNKEGYKSFRPDAHCTNCGCTLSAKTKCLECECPLKKWLAITKTKENENT